ncbi:SDR family oxidoreductase [Actinocorallia longicatena]|uniref:SDR family NAD(P)-dependent oxidoreductase n=1 Tax=Actinocorallia longicatena TaxID=111803 RepID=A0ABP6QC71_9ACTN
MSDQPLNGTVALVTGATGGIGAATARRLASEGASVALVAGHHGPLERVTRAITASGGHAVAIAADLTEPGGTDLAVDETLDRLGRLDVLVNGAETMLLDSALHTPVEAWDRMIAVNVAALLHLTHAAVPHLIYAASTSPRQVADLVSVGSTAGRAARPGSSVYGLTKAWLGSFSEALRRELLDESVRVAVVEPGTGPVRPEDVADAVGYIVTRGPRTAVSEMLIRSPRRTR